MTLRDFVTVDDVLFAEHYSIILISRSLYNNMYGMELEMLKDLRTMKRTVGLDKLDVITELS